MKRRSMLRATAAWAPTSLFGGTARAQINFYDRTVMLNCLQFPGKPMIILGGEFVLGDPNIYFGPANQRDQQHDYVWRVTGPNYKGGRQVGFAIGSVFGYSFLQGRPLGGIVGIGSLDEDGAYWDITNAGGGAVFIRCLSDLDGPKWLEGRPDNGRTIKNTVALTTSTATPSTRWQLAAPPLGFMRIALWTAFELTPLPWRSQKGPPGGMITPMPLLIFCWSSRFSRDLSANVPLQPIRGDWGD